MTWATDRTNDPTARSWVRSANDPQGAFPLQNLPYAVFRRSGGAGTFRGGVAIGDEILDLDAVARCGVFRGAAAEAVQAAALPTLNALMQQGADSWRALRFALFDGLLEGAREQAVLESCLLPRSGAEYALPAQIGDYTDFYSSIHHATAVGRLFRPDNPLLPNYKWLPIGYHGRASSIAVSGQAFHRPIGQRLPPNESQPILGPSARLDYEFELGIFVGAGNPLGQPIPISEAESHVFGLCLLNDWSARDLQAWEAQPLGPFLAKNFATTISPWVVTLQALAPFRCPSMRAAGDPPLLPYLTSDWNSAAGAFDIQLEASLETADMRKRADPPYLLSATSYRHAYWSVAQLVAHHTINGCNLCAGDLIGTGTQSGPTAGEAGSLLELSVGGTRPLRVGVLEQRTFLEDGDTVILRASCSKAGAATVGFGEVRGTVLPAIVY